MNNLEKDAEQAMGGGGDNLGGGGGNMEQEAMKDMSGGGGGGGGGNQQGGSSGGGLDNAINSGAYLSFPITVASYTSNQERSLLTVGFSL